VSRTGRLLKERRLMRGWTQQELGDASGVDQRAISRLERGVTTPEGVGAGVVRELASALEIGTEEMLLVAASDLIGYDVDPRVVRAVIALQRLSPGRRDALLAQIEVEAAEDAREGTDSGDGRRTER